MAGSIIIDNTFATQAGPIPLSELDANFAQLVSEANSLLTQNNYYADTGAANALVVTVPSPQTVSYTAGLAILVKVGHSNTGASTINVNGLGVVNITTQSLSALSAGMMLAGSIVTLIYDGTQFQLQSATGSFSTITTGTLTVGSGGATIGGDTTITGGASGSALTVNGGSAVSSAVYISSGISTGLNIYNSTGGTASSGIVFGSPGSTGLSAGIFGTAATTTSGSLQLQYAYGGALTTGLSISSLGAVVIPATQSSGTYSLAVTGASNTYAGRFLGASVTGQSYGLSVLAGYNSSDKALAILNQSGATPYMTVYGDGGVTVGSPTGGTEGVGSINAQSLYVNGVGVYGTTPIQSVSSYTTVLGDANTIIYTGTTSVTFTIGNVGYPVGTWLMFVSGGAATATVALASGTMYWAGNGSTGSRTIAQRSYVVAYQFSSGVWYISGPGIS